MHLTPTAAAEFGKRNGSRPRSRWLHSHSLKATRSTQAQLPQVGRCEEWNIKELRRQVATAFGRFRAREDAPAGWGRDAEGAALVRVQGCLIWSHIYLTLPCRPQGAFAVLFEDRRYRLASPASRYYYMTTQGTYLCLSLPQASSYRRL
jgi:hypothetical protein